MPTRKSPDRELAEVQSAITDQDAQISPEDRAKERPAGLYVPLTSKLTGDDEQDKYKTGETEEFRIRSEASFMSIMEWIGSADDGNGSGSMAAYYHILQDIVHKEDWDAFRRFARLNYCEYEDFKDFQNAAFEAISGNPTKQPAG